MLSLDWDDRRGRHITEGEAYAALEHATDEELIIVASGYDYFERGQGVGAPNLRLGPAGVARQMLLARRVPTIQGYGDYIGQSLAEKRVKELNDLIEAHREKIRKTF